MLIYLLCTCVMDLYVYGVHKYNYVCTERVYIHYSKKNYLPINLLHFVAYDADMHRIAQTFNMVNL